MPSFRISDLPPRIIAMIRPADRAALGLDAPAPPKEHSRTDPRLESPPRAKERPSASRSPNKTEARYRDERLRGLDARYEALTVHLANGHRYTPDWVVHRADGGVECHEVKGSYRLHSQDGARMRFDQARLEWPEIRWVWATWTGKVWKIEDSGEGMT